MMEYTAIDEERNEVEAEETRRERKEERGNVERLDMRSSGLISLRMARQRGCGSKYWNIAHTGPR